MAQVHSHMARVISTDQRNRKQKDPIPRPHGFGPYSQIESPQLTVTWRRLVRHQFYDRKYSNKYLRRHASLIAICACAIKDAPPNTKIKSRHYFGTFLFLTFCRLHYLLSSDSRMTIFEFNDIAQFERKQ